MNDDINGKTIVVVRDDAGPLDEMYVNVGVGSYYVYKSGGVPAIMRKEKDRDITIMSSVDYLEIFEFLMKNEPYLRNGET